MKKILLIFFCMMLVSVNIFAENNDLSNGNGNGGKDKIGGWIGFPIAGLSYSHEFNDLMEFDLLAGVSGIPFFARKLNLRTGLLFTVWEPVIKGQKCPLTIGPAVDINGFMVLFVPASIGLKILCPIRWEVNFGHIPTFNLFIEAAPAIGFSYFYSGFQGNNQTVGSQNKHTNGKINIDWFPHIGIGLRYRIPNKK